MFEKVNPDHPDKIADRIAGALVDLAYKKEKDPRIAVEVLIGHGTCHIVCESSVKILEDEAWDIVDRIAGEMLVDFLLVPQDVHLSDNQKGSIRCGDNGIFKGVPVTDEQRTLAAVADNVYHTFPSDGKYILSGDRLIICQSKADKYTLEGMYPSAEVNPIGYWTGGPEVDSGATNRKLGSDMGDSVTGGGLHGKDLSKADVSMNIFVWLLAQKTGKPVQAVCAIGDEKINGIPYGKIVETARQYIRSIGGFEKFAEWGLIRYEDNK